MIFNQTNHIIAHGSFEILDEYDSVSFYVPGYKNSMPSLVLTPIGTNANVNVFVDESATAYTTSTYDLTKPFFSKDGEHLYDPNTAAWAAEVDYPYKGTLVAWWRLNKDITGDGIAEDSGAFGVYNGLQVISADRPTFSQTLFPSRYVQSGSCTFDGTRDHIELGSYWDGIIGNDTPGTSQMTFSAWVYRDITASGTQAIISFGTTSALLYLNDEDVRFQTHWGPGTSWVLWEATSYVVPTNTWTHVAVTYDATDKDNTPYIYIDGKLSNATENGTSPVDPWGGIVGDSYIGAYSSGPGGPWTGQIADVAVWNSILTSTQIKAIYNASIAGAEPSEGWSFTVRRSSDVGNQTIHWQSIAPDGIRAPNIRSI